MIGDIVVYENCVGVVTDVSDTDYVLATNYGTTITVNKKACTPMLAATQVLNTFRGVICKKGQ